MRELRPMILLVACVAFLSAVPSQAADEVTIGRFVQELARIKQVDAADVQTAVGSLTGAGVRIPADIDFSGPLTEGDVARLSRLVGLELTTTRPDRLFGARRLDVFFEVFASELQPRGSSDESETRGQPSGGPEFDPYGKGNGGSKGKKKGHRSPSDPE